MVESAGRARSGWFDRRRWVRGRRWSLAVTAVLALIAAQTVLAVGASAAGSQTLYAAAAASGSGDCSEANACSLPTALGELGAGGTILLVTSGPSAPSASSCSASDCYVGVFTVSTASSAAFPVTIEAAPGVTNATLDGNNNNNTVLTVDSGVDLNLVGVTITGGNASQGGGILNNGTSSVVRSTITGNSAQNGPGGGILNNNGTLSVSQSTITGNSAVGGGGGIFNGGSINGGTLSVVQSTITDNTAPGGDGGGIYNANGATLSVVQSTIASNTAQYGHGIVNRGSSTFLAGDVLATPGGAPSGGECSGGGVTDGGFNVADDNTCGFTSTTSVVSANAGLLGSLADNGGPTETILPQVDNPVIGLIPQRTSVYDTVTNTTVELCPTVDQRGLASVSGGACDAGAVQTSELLYAAASGSGDCSEANACSLPTALGELGAG
ncbi:MAG: choice-of-anchor Q domain-containing protein, partial [Acidimicrobiales bacterium]